MIMVTHAVLLSAVTIRQGTWFSPQAAKGWGQAGAPPSRSKASCSHRPKLQWIVLLDPTTTTTLTPGWAPPGHPPQRLSRTRSPWSAWKCMTCCGGRCPGERPRRRPPGSQCKPPTRWSSSLRLCGRVPPCPPQRGGRPAAAAAPPGSSPPPGTSAGCRAGGGSRCLPAAGPSPWREEGAACSTRCWGVWWRQGCARRHGGWRWRRSPQGHQAAVTRSSPVAAWWCRGTRDTAGPSGWSSSAAGTPSSTCACSPAAWAAGAGCSSWSKSGTPAGSPGTVSPWWPARRGEAPPAWQGGLATAPRSRLPLLLLRKAGKSAGKPLVLIFQHLRQTEKRESVD